LIKEEKKRLDRLETVRLKKETQERILQHNADVIMYAKSEQSELRKRKRNPQSI